ncbi:MAG: TonB family protein [Betaproteobacteria bacterium]
MSGSAAVPRQHRYGWSSLLASSILHLAALCLIGAGQPGEPAGLAGGLPGGRLYALNYLGVMSGGEPPPTVAQPAVSVSAARPAVVPSAPPRAKPVKPSAGQLLTSTKGREMIPLPPKPSEEAKEVKPDSGATAPVAESAGVSAGQGAPPPPKGSSMVTALPRLVYPKAAQNAGLRGTVRLRVTVSPGGKPIRVEVEQSSGERILDEYARRAVERGFTANPWVNPYLLQVEVRFAEGVPEVRVLDEPVEIGG